MTQTVRRLPGIRFETQAPPIEEVLPRMDIAGFVGIAASGPIDVPVPVEDAAQFAAIFGVDAPLAWDVEHGEQAYAFLGPAVRAFFRNGGVRCWVVRVADTSDAKANAFALPGIAAVGTTGRLAPAQLRARSEGSWSDGLSTYASLEPSPVRLELTALKPEPTFAGLLGSNDELVVGDLVRVSFPASPWTLLVPVAAIDAAEHSPPGAAASQLRAVTVTGGQAWWMRIATVPTGRHGHLHYLGLHGGQHSVAAVVAEPVDGGEGLLRVSLTEPTANPPLPGSLVRGVFSSRTVWIDVEDVDAARAGSLAVVGTPLQVTRSAPSTTPVQAPDALAERLTLRLEVVDASGSSTVLSGLGFAPSHPRFAAELPTDVELYSDPSSPPDAGSLAADAAQPRFPLAGPSAPPPLYLPVGASILRGAALPAIRPAGLNRLRDGLERLDASLFVDPALATTDTSQLLSTAFWIRDQQPNPRPLRAMHALLDVDEVTMVVVPDAVQRRWYLAPGSHIPKALASEPAPKPDWSKFLACTTHVPASPTLSQLGDEESGAFTLEWTATDVKKAAYELQVTTDPSNDAAAEDLYTGPQRQFSIYGRPRGSTLYYRVRALAGGLASDWSNWIVVRTTQTTRWLLDQVADYDPTTTLLPVQLALLRMCAARGDQFGVLALPEHYRERAAILHVQSLKSTSPPGSAPNPIFTFGGLYHPWLFTADPANPATIRRSPPDGAAAGVIASRSIRRGPWLAPANEPLRDVVQLDPPLGPDWYQALQDAQVNVVRHEPAGFLWLAADTLSDDDDLRPIGVRRLLCQLRRAALKYGNAYAFEPNSDVLRRSVQRGFEKLLSRAFALGAFAGATASQAYQVNTGSPPNTPDTLQAGQFIVELKVAPSRPLTFLTVLLVRTGEGSLQLDTR